MIFNHIVLNEMKKNMLNRVASFYFGIIYYYTLFNGINLNHPKGWCLWAHVEGSWN